MKMIQMYLANTDLKVRRIEKLYANLCRSIGQDYVESDYLAFSIKRGIFWHIVLINRRVSTVLFFARALSKRRVEDKLYNWCLCMKMNEVIEYEGKSF